MGGPLSYMILRHIVIGVEEPLIQPITLLVRPTGFTRTIENKI